MNQAATQPYREIKKRHIKETVLFAINHVPQADKTTLVQFLDLVNADGTFGAVTQDQVLTKMRLLLTYIPSASASSLRILAALLQIPGDRVQ